ncbi:hypothetical protein E5676_scaffold506G001020 [Cucumis melo var. makuwa]|uniref:Uncharacterized protein n=1 Tax=Cucumis melo var. makuwa TaxID=1194695 RepID=A0A5A7T4G5_CUCMM|nr:hypothetical protein E6C27_scaffold270G002330 [Cucumis melo var. makuwa]TYJ97039.1 hypothetical protein E5676_scaffold506G001020 [Cucumis melo var. makuwa]
MDKAMLFYYTMEEISMNVDEIICEHILALVKNRLSGLRRIINLHKNKAKDKCLKTKKERKVDEVTEVESKEEDEMEDETYPIEP